MLLVPNLNENFAVVDDPRDSGAATRVLRSASLAPIAVSYAGDHFSGSDLLLEMDERGCVLDYLMPQKTVNELHLAASIRVEYAGTQEENNARSMTWWSC